MACYQKAPCLMLKMRLDGFYQFLHVLTVVHHRDRVSDFMAGDPSQSFQHFPSLQLDAASCAVPSRQDRGGQGMGVQHGARFQAFDDA